MMALNKQKKILHIFPESMFIEDFFLFIERNYSDIKHDFIVIDIGGSGEATKIKERFIDKYNVVNISTFNIKDVKVLHNKLRKSKSYDNIIFHSLSLNYLLISLLTNIKAVKKATVVFWAIQDAGPFIIPKDRNEKIRSWIYEKLRCFIIPRFKYISTVIDSEYERIKPIYNITAAYKLCKYPRDKPCVKEQAKEKKSNYINIQAGHAGFELTNTTETLNILKKFKDENIRIFSPLSYGNKNYINDVIKTGKEIFGQKFIPLTNQMSGDKYEKLLSYMDIYIHNSTGQMGLGNIDINMALMNKVYLNDKGVVYNDYVMQGYNVSRVSDINNQSFDVFSHYDTEDAKNNKKLSDDLLNDSNFIKIWDNLLLDIK